MAAAASLAVRNLGGTKDRRRYKPVDLKIFSQAMAMAAAASLGVRTPGGTKMGPRHWCWRYTPPVGLEKFSLVVAAVLAAVAVWLVAPVLSAVR